MAFSTPRTIFGLHSITPYSRTDGIPYGSVRVAGSSSLSRSSELIELFGGSQKYAWAAEDGQITAEMKLKFSQYEDFLMELFLGTAPTPIAPDGTGAVSALVNKKGVSLMDATTGIASVAATAADEGDLKFGKFVVKAMTTTTINIYAKTDIDLKRGNDATVQDDQLKLLASNVSVTTAGTHAIAELGITFTGGSGTIGFTQGDTAEFEVLPIHGGAMSVRVGSANNTVFPEFGAVVVSQKRADGQMFEIDLFRCKAAGMPLGFERNAWSESEVTVKCLYDSALDGLFDLRYVKPTTAT